jgi:hypothetical protein
VTLRISPDVRWRVIDGDVVIVSQQNGEVLGLNETGSRLFELLAEGKTLPEVIERLCAEFDAPADDIDAAVRALTAELMSIDVLVGSLPARDPAHEEQP